MRGLDAFRSGGSLPEGEYPEQFCEFAVEWNWPTRLSRNRTVQVRNLVSVLWRMYRHGPPYNDVATYQEARDWRASKARAEDPNREEEYGKTVHAHCVRATGFEGNQAMHDFLPEARRLIKAYDRRHGDTV